MTPETLNAAMLAAHEARDGPALARLYRMAADQADDPQAAGFYLTHAFVFALEAGMAEAVDINRRLVAAGRELPLPDGDFPTPT